MSKNVKIKDIPAVAELWGIHVTSDPTRMLWALKAGYDISKTRGPEKVGDLYSGGLYFSTAPQLWMGRAYGKWEFLAALNKKQRAKLIRQIGLTLAEQLKTHYISEHEHAWASRQLEHFGKLGHGDFIIPLADQPYNIRFWHQEYLKPLGIEQKRPPMQIEVKAKGTFANLTGMRITPELIDNLKKTGFDGAFIESGIFTIPQSVVWNAEAITQFGSWQRVPYGINPNGSFAYGESEKKKRERIEWLKAEIRNIDSWLPKAKDPNTGFWLKRRANLQKSLDSLAGESDPDIEEAPPWERNPLTEDEMRNVVRDAEGALRIARQHQAAGEHIEAIRYAEKAFAEVCLLDKYNSGWDSPEAYKLYKRAGKAAARAISMLEYYRKNYKAVFFRRKKMRDAVEQAAAYAENMYGKNPRPSMLPLITQMERGVLPKTYTLKKSDVGKLIDMFTFGRVRTFDVGKRIFLRQGIIQMESIQQMEKRKAKANPLIPAEFNIAIDMVSKHIDKARSLVGTDPHAAEEEAYQAIGILKAVEEAGKGLISISGEKKEIIRRLYGICQQIIGRADGAQGRPVPNPRYGFARRHYQLVAEIFANVGWGIGADARIAVTHALTLFIDAFTRDNPRFDTGKFINAAAPWMNKSQKEAVIAPFRR